MMQRDGETGMILVNVLMMVAIAAGLVLLMINREEIALDRGLRVTQAAQAAAVMRGGELSALVALRRDAETAPNEDYAGEPWGAVSETGARIEHGSFDLVVSDAEGRFNVNNVRAGDAPSTILFQAIAREAGMADDQIEQAIVLVRTAGPITDLRPLRMAGIDPAVATKLAALVTALPGHTTINLNAAPEPLLALLFRDPAAAARLVALRDRAGRLRPEDLATAHVTLPWGTSFRSTSFWVRARTTIGDTSQQEAVLIRRVEDADGTIRALPIARWRNAAVPPDAPAFLPKRR
jgi:general secretion pathway protein K